jgi:hypothetical protein
MTTLPEPRAELWAAMIVPFEIVMPPVKLLFPPSVQRPVPTLARAVVPPPPQAF